MFIGSKNPSRIAPFEPSGLSDSELEFELAAEKKKNYFYNDLQDSILIA
jgi:hypothetical protein